MTYAVARFIELGMPRLWFFFKNKLVNGFASFVMFCYFEYESYSVKFVGFFIKGNKA